MASAAAPRRSVTAGAAMTAGSQAVSAACSALSAVLVARILGPHGVGVYAVYQALFFALSIVGTGGLDQGVTYLVASGRWAARRAFWPLQRMALVFGLLGAAAGLLFDALVPSVLGAGSTARVAVACAALPFFLSWLYSSAVALGGRRYALYVAPRTAQAALVPVFVAGGAALEGVGGAVAGFVLSHVVAALGNLAVAARRLRAEAGDAPAEDARPLRAALAYGARTYAATTLQVLNYRLDLFILSAVAASREVGYYSVAVTVAQTVWLLPQAVSGVLMQRIAALGTTPGADAARVAVEGRALRHVALIVVATAGALAAVAAVALPVVFGERFRPSIDLLLLLLPGVAAFGLVGPLWAALMGRGAPVALLHSVLITTPVTVALYAVLVPAFEARGAAIGSTISYTTLFAVSGLLYRRASGQNPFAMLVPGRGELADYARLARRLTGRGPSAAR